MLRARMLSRLSTLSLLGALSGGALLCVGCDQESYHKLEKGDPMLWDREQVKQVPEDKLPPDVLHEFHRQFPGASITGAEQRKSQNGGAYLRVYFEKSDGSKSSMDYGINPRTSH